MIRRLSLILIGLAVFAGIPSACRAEVPIVQDGRPLVPIFVDVREAEGDGPAVLEDAGDWLAQSIRRATGATPEFVEKLPDDGSAIVIARAEAWPDVARQVGLKPGIYDAYAIATKGNRVYILGNSESAARHGVADVLRRWGFRWFAPSPRWHIVPETNSLSIDLNITETPALIERRIWYAYGMRDDDLAPLMENYTRWAIANRLSVRTLMRTGHSYGNIIRRNQKVFDQHPEYYALLPSGERDATRAINARKFCYSNPGLMELVAEDRLRLLEEEQKANPAAFMVSVDPSDGEGTCHCENCQALGTTTDRVFHLANAVARRLKKADPNAWSGLYAYSSHRMPPTITVEPNVYVQVAMGFNKTQYTLPELVERWSHKVEAIGLREYYGVEAWDWGLPGRMRGGQVDYHRKWIPYYAQRKLNAINAETNANWGGQTLGLYVASQLMWNPKLDVDQLTEEFYQLSFGEAKGTMQAFYAKLDAAPPLRSATLLPLFEDLETAWKQTRREDVKGRLVDLMAYLVYVSKYRDFALVSDREPTRNDAYYEALKPLMEYTWQIRHRDIVHYYALARRLCNGLPVQDQRLDFYMFNKDRDPVWKHGDSLSDEQIRKLFTGTTEELRQDDDPTITYSRFLDRVKPEGNNAGPSRILSEPRVAVARFRHGLRGYVVPNGKAQVEFGIIPTSKRVVFTVQSPHGEKLFEREYRADSSKTEKEATLKKVLVDLPRANEYRVDIQGDFVLHVPPETPFVFEASITHPAWISYSGPHYFYIPRGTKELIVDANPRLSLEVPGAKKRLDIHPADRQAGKQYVIIPVPEGAAGQLWHTTNMTRGKVSFLNVPPLLSFHPAVIFVPREVAESDGLTTRK